MFVQVGFLKQPKLLIYLDRLIYGVKILEINLVCYNKTFLCLRTQFSLNMHKLWNYNIQG
jgi:hypothetical protein